MLKQLNSLLKVKGRSNIQLLSYDTTFNITEFYVSVLLFPGTCFKENPVIPAMFMLHERKLRTTHQKFVEILSEKVPALNSSNVILVTDGEPSFDVFKNAFPKLNSSLLESHTVVSQGMTASARRNIFRRIAIH